MTAPCIDLPCHAVPCHIRDQRVRFRAWGLSLITFKVVVFYPVFDRNELQAPTSNAYFLGIINTLLEYVYCPWEGPIVRAASHHTVKLYSGVCERQILPTS